MKVGLIGCGRVAHIHMNAFKLIPNLDVVSIADNDSKRAKAFAESYKIGKVFNNYLDMLETKDLDFVDICTPTSTHESIVSDSSKNGLNVLMEKPMGRNSPECERMINIAHKHKIQLCVCHNQLFYPYVQRLKSMAESKDFNLVSFRTSHRENFEWLKAHDLAQPWNVHPEHGGILWEVGTHLAYLHLAFLKDIVEVYALGTKGKYSVWDDFAILLRTASGHWGVFEISWVAKESEIVYEIIGSQGQRIQTYVPHGYFIERMNDSASGLGGVLHNYFSDHARLYKKWSKFVVDQVKKPQYGHYRLISSYVESLQKGTSSPVTGEDGRNAIKLLECIEKSLNEKRPVEFSSL